MKLLSVIFISFFVLKISAQTTNEQGIEIRQKVGFLAAHKGIMAHLPVELGKAIEITYYQHTRGFKVWHKAYRYPTIGATLFIGSVGNNKILGRYLGAYGFAEFPLIKYKNYELDWKLGCGFGYTNKRYDPIENPKGVAIGSHVDAMICVGLKSIYRFKRNAVTLGLDMTHFSNAAYQVPNFGINLPYVSIGYSHRFGKEKRIIDTNHFEYPTKKWLYGVYGIFSMKQVMPIGGRRYPVYAGGIALRRFFNHKAGLEIDLDIISKQAILGYEPLVPKTQFRMIQLGLAAAYLVPLDHFHFVFGMGVYLRDYYKPEDPVYHRIGMRYQFSSGLIANFTLKTHFARADYMELGLGYTINYKKNRNE
jgi:hypothetical protein